MSLEEKIPDDSELNSPAESKFPSTSEGDQQSDSAATVPKLPNNSDPIDAVIVPSVDSDVVYPQATIVEAALVTPGKVSSFRRFSATPKISANLDNIAANGGAVGAVVLGIWSLIGVFVTSWSIINGLLGLLLGLWGLSSGRRRLAMLGILMCLASILLGLLQVGEILNTYMNPVDENPL